MKKFIYPFIMAHSLLKVNRILGGKGLPLLKGLILKVEAISSSEKSAYLQKTEKLSPLTGHEGI
jgi:hypothetical protein